MELKEYAEKAAGTAIYKTADYPFILLAEETGEVLGKLNKFARKNGCNLESAIGVAGIPDNGQEAKGQNQYELRQAVILELGDIAWGFVECCRMLNIDPGDVLQANINKLYGRSVRGTIDGAGDDR